MRRVAILSVGLVALVACEAPDAEPRGEVSQAIVGGTTSPASQDATVLLSETGYPSCTGVLIAPNLVLTARHCVTDYNDRSECGGPLGASAYASALTVSVGANAYPSSFVARGARLVLPDANELCGADIALLILDNDVQGVTPAKVRFSGPALDDVTTAVGYGDNSGPRDQRSDVRVLAVGPSRSTYRTTDGYPIPMNIAEDEISTTESTCFGDSGGPLFDAEGKVVAVASRGLDERCRDRPTVWTTFAGHAQLIKDAAAAAGHPITEPVVTTPPPKAPAVNGQPVPSGTPDDEPSSDDTSKTRKRGSNNTQGSAGCATSRRSPSESPLALFGLVVLASLLRRRR